MNPNYDPSTQYTANYFIFRRSTDTGSGFKPTGVSVVSGMSEEGAKAALKHFFKRQGREGASQHGTWLVHSPQGAWIFDVAPPEPMPNVITVR